MSQKLDQGIIRVIKQKDFTSISRHALQDSRLSFTARGVLGYLLSKPDDWTVRNADLQREGNIGRDKVEKILRELREHGYLHRTRVQLSNGRWHWISAVYEEPYPENTGMEPCPDLPSTVNTGIYKKQNIGAVAPQHASPINDIGGALAPEQDSVSVYVEITGYRSLTTEHKTLIKSTVTDLIKWRGVVSEWKARNYRSSNIPDMLDVYINGWGSNRRASETQPQPQPSNGIAPIYISAADEALARILGGNQ